MEQQEYEILVHVFDDLKSLLCQFENQRILSERLNYFQFDDKEDIFKVMKNYQRILDNANMRLKDNHITENMKKFYKWQVDFVFMRFKYLSKNLDYIDEIKRNNALKGV